MPTSKPTASGRAQRAAERDKRDDALRRKKIAAQRAVQAAVRAGRLHRGPCEVCGTTENIHGHHGDYSKPLEVRWLCGEHHADLHGWTPEDSAMLAVDRAVNKLQEAGDNYFRPSKELADLQRQRHRLQRQKEYRRGEFWMPYSQEAETNLENAGAEYMVAETAEGKMIRYFEANEVKP